MPDPLLSVSVKSSPEEQALKSLFAAWKHWWMPRWWHGCVPRIRTSFQGCFAGMRRSRKPEPFQASPGCSAFASRTSSSAPSNSDRRGTPSGVSLKCQQPQNLFYQKTSRLKNIIITQISVFKNSVADAEKKKKKEEKSQSIFPKVF